MQRANDETPTKRILVSLPLAARMIAVNVPGDAVFRMTPITEAAATIFEVEFYGCHEAMRFVLDRLPKSVAVIEITPRQSSGHHVAFRIVNLGSLPVAALIERAYAAISAVGRGTDMQYQFAAYTVWRDWLTENGSDITTYRDARYSGERDFIADVLAVRS